MERCWKILLTASAAGCLLPVTAVAQSKSAGVRGNPAIFFGPDAYPVEAIRLGQEGRVVASLAIDSSGKVVACTVQQSSGSPSLDNRTCEIALSKVVFEPARDQRGRPISARYTLPVRWVLPKGPIDVALNPLPDRTVDITLSVDPGGIVAACNAMVTPKTDGGASPCDQFPVGSQSQFRWVRDGKPVGGTIKQHYAQEIAIDP